MFKDDYNAQMNEIAPDEEKKSEILKMLNENAVQKVTPLEKKAKMLKTRNIWRMGFAAAAAVAVTLSVIFVPDWRHTQTVAPSGHTVTKAESYAEIYEKIQDLTTDKATAKSSARGFITSLFGAKGSNSMDDGAAEDYYDSYVDEAADAEFTNGTASENTKTSAGASDLNDSAQKSDNDDYSKTNTQVEGVEEADIVRTDGRYIYALRDGSIYVIRAGAGVPEKVSVIDLELGQYAYCHDFYLANGKVTAVIQKDDESAYRKKTAVYDSAYRYGASGASTVAKFYDVSDPVSPKKTGESSQSGESVSSRMIGDRLYLISTYWVSGNTDKDKPETFVPSVSCSDKTEPVPADKVCIYTAEKYDPIYTVVGIYDSADGKMLDSQSLLGGSSEVYCSEKSLLTTVTDYSNAESKTVVSRFSLSKDAVKYENTAEINGALLNQFSMDEYNGYFRFVTTVDKNEESTVSGNSSTTYTRVINRTDVSLVILDSSLQPVSSLNDLAEGERVYSVRFMGDTAYFVTFRETDPLFSVDLSDPKKPTVLGKLKIPGFSNYLFPYGSGKLLGIGMDADEKTGKTDCLKLSMFDISDPANVSENDKYLIKDYSYSSALYNHKASLVDPQKNLIGFTADSNKDSVYMLFRYDNGEFVNIASLELNGNDYTDEIRGLFIGDVFYLVEGKRVKAYSLDGFTLLGELLFVEN